ncbi:MAG: hypothetical protein C4523_06860 [Myxococcales bacterium]|nr:MAG: hypothetical protein C4523_06860 [Myxococcales bacterium]
MAISPVEKFGSPGRSLNKIPIILEIEFLETEKPALKYDIPSIVSTLRLAREIKTEMDVNKVSMRQAARNRALTTTRIFQLLQLLNLPPEILTFIDSLADRNLGNRFLTERKVRSWLELEDPQEQLQAFRLWNEKHETKLSGVHRCQHQSKTQTCGHDGLAGEG